MGFTQRQYDYDDRPVKVRTCEHPGCHAAGGYRAPKSRDLKDYFWFCLDHVRSYNKAWDYFAGMSSGAIEQHIRNATVWERPTWPLGEWQKREQQLRDKINRDFFGGADTDFTQDVPPVAAPAEREALAVLELKSPVSFDQVKAQYRLLVKRHHPDANGGAAEAEEKLKQINQAFTVLRQIYALDTTE